jgi:hypothetical protein
MHDTDDDRGAARPRRGWAPHLTWSALLVAGWLLYEATAQPGLAAFVVCAKFGWPDLRAARWLLRVDPDRRRGQTCFWFYLAFGLWKVAVMATALMLLLLFLGTLFPRMPRRAGGWSPVLGGVLAAAGLGFGLSFLATYAALASALRNRVKVWLGPAAHRARTGRFWPPAHGVTNAAPFVTVTTLIITLWVVLLTLLGLVIAWGPGVLLSFVLLLGLFVGAFPAFLVIFRALDHRVFARSPGECWDALPGEEVYESADAALG